MSSKFGDLVHARQRENAATQKPGTGGAKGRGRPRAKRSNPEYQQVTAYIRKQTYTAARKVLLDQDREFSDLVEELVSNWVKARP